MALTTPLVKDPCPLVGIPHQNRGRPADIRGGPSRPRSGAAPTAWTQPTRRRRPRRGRVSESNTVGPFTLKGDIHIGVDIQM